MMKWFYNLKLAVKISVLSSVFTVFILVIGVTGLMNMNTLNNSLRTLNDDRLIPVYDLEEAQSHLKDLKVAVDLHTTSHNEANNKKLEDEISKYEADMFEHIDKYKKTYLVDDEKKGIAEFDKAFKEYKDAEKKLLSLSDGGKQEDAVKLNDGEIKAKYDQVVASLDSLINIQMKVAEDLHHQSESTYHTIMFVFPGLILLCIAAGFAISFVTVKAVVLPVGKVYSKLKEISENGGDLTQRIGLGRKDEIGQLSKAFDAFMEKLQSMIGMVKESAQVIASSSHQLSAATSESNKAVEQIAQTINHIADGISGNVAATQQTTASIHEAARFSESTAQASRRASQNGVKVREAAENSAVQVDEVEVTINNIAGSSQEVADAIRQLDESSKKIGEIVQIITSISGQTNLLALNAAIEAARAGEAGKGFNVVAEEIRKLADESSKAAKEIVALVRENRERTERSVESVTNVDRMVAVGVEKAVAVKNNIHNISENIKDVVKQVGEIDQAVERQASISDEITKVMHSIADSAGEMSAGTEEISASVDEHVGTMEEIEAAAQQLSEMASRLNEITSGFTV